MANILNIDTSSTVCSVCVACEGEIKIGFESSVKMDHSSSLAPFVEKCMTDLRARNEKLDAVSVSNGPGSYTGLRIGLSLAKGIAYGNDIPLITLSTLEVMAARAIFSYPDIMGDELIVPMVDARRMEVYTGVYNCRLQPVEKARAEILTPDSFSAIYGTDKILFIGDGCNKFRQLYKGGNAVWLGNGMSHAKYMAPLSQKYFNENKFADVAYATPFYLKDYQATQPKSRI